MSSIDQTVVYMLLIMGAAVVALIAFGIGVLAGVQSERDRATSAGAARFVLDSVTGEVKFEYIRAPVRPPSGGSATAPPSPKDKPCV